MDRESLSKIIDTLNVINGLLDNKNPLAFKSSKQLSESEIAVLASLEHEVREFLQLKMTALISGDGEMPVSVVSSQFTDQQAGVLVEFADKLIERAQAATVTIEEKTDEIHQDDSRNLTITNSTGRKESPVMTALKMGGYDPNADVAERARVVKEAEAATRKKNVKK